MTQGATDFVSSSFFSQINDLVPKISTDFIQKNTALASGYVTAELEKDAFAAGASALVYKPNDVNELCETVQHLIQGGSAF